MLLANKGNLVFLNRKDCIIFIEGKYNFKCDVPLARGKCTFQWTNGTTDELSQLSNSVSLQTSSWISKSKRRGEGRKGN